MRLSIRPYLGTLVVALACFRVEVVRLLRNLPQDMAKPEPTNEPSRSEEADKRDRSFLELGLGPGDGFKYSGGGETEVAESQHES